MSLKESFLMLAILILATRNSNAVESYELMLKKDCTPIRLDQEEPGSKIRIGDQDGLSICGAYSTAYLADYERLKKNPHAAPLISPLALAVQTAKQSNMKTLIVDDPLLIADSVRKVELCDSSAVSDHFANQTNGRFITALYDSFEKRNPQNLRQCLLRSGFDNRQISNLKDLTSYLEKGDFVSFTAELLGDLCKDRSFRLPDFPRPTTMIAARMNMPAVAAQTRFRNIINDNLNQKKPTAINYCGLVRSDPSFIGVAKSGLLDRSCVVDGNSMGHSSVIVGRRLLKYKDGNETRHICQFLVRDSYGASCAKYPDDPTSDPAIRCENGQYWVDEDALMGNTAEIFHY